MSYKTILVIHEHKDGPSIYVFKSKSFTLENQSEFIPIVVEHFEIDLELEKGETITFEMNEEKYIPKIEL